MRIQARLDRRKDQCRGSAVPGPLPQAVLEGAGAAPLQQIEDLRCVRPVGEQFHQRVVHVALVGQKIGLERGELEAPSHRLDDRDRLAEPHGGELVLPALQADAAQPVERLPLFLGGLAQPEQRLAAVEARLHCLPPVAALLRERQRLGEGAQRGLQVAQIERLDDADVLQHAELAVAMPILREELLRRAVGLERLERIFEPAVEDAQVGEQARLLARGQGLGRSLRLQVYLQRLVVAAQAQEEGAQVDEGEALAPRVLLERGRARELRAFARVERELELDLGHSAVRALQSSGNNTTSSMPRRYPTPDVPPVPRFQPMMRSTVVAWRKRHCRNASSRSTSFSASS